MKPAMLHFLPFRAWAPFDNAHDADKYRSSNGHPVVLPLRDLPRSLKVVERATNALISRCAPTRAVDDVVNAFHSVLLIANPLEQSLGGVKSCGPILPCFGLQPWACVQAVTSVAFLGSTRGTAVPVSPVCASCLGLVDVGRATTGPYVDTSAQLYAMERDVAI